MTNLLTFEHPLNERIRTFLRLEHLFERFDYFAAQYDPLTTRVAIEALLDIIAVTARADVKNELLKELERNLATLQGLARQPGVDPETLQRVLRDLETAISGIQRVPGPIGQTARMDEFLKSVAQRSAIPGGTCSFDLPHFHHWLVQPPDQRQRRLEHWLQDLRPAEVAIRLMLSLARGSATPRQVVAPSGFFQEALDAQIPAQMLRVCLNGTRALYPEISGHKNRFSIRFMTIETAGRVAQAHSDIPFRLTCCVL